MRRAMMHHANRSRALGVVSLAGAVTLLAACATQPGEPGAGQPLTPTSRYVLQVEPGVDRIALAVRPDGVSHNQNAALSDLTHRFAMSGAPRVVVEAPGGNDPAAAAFAWAARDAVAALGVPMDRIVVAAYAAPDPRAPVLVVSKPCALMCPSAPDASATWPGMRATSRTPASAAPSPPTWRPRSPTRVTL